MSCLEEPPPHVPKAHWTVGQFPPVVHSMLFDTDYAGVLCGSQAQTYHMAPGLGPLEGRDWDVFVPVENWALVARLAQPLVIGSTMSGGLKLRSNGFDVDVWPDTWFRLSASAVANKPYPAHAVDFLRGLLLKSERM